MKRKTAPLKGPSEGVQMFVDFFKRLGVVLDSHPALNAEERDAWKLEGKELTQEFELTEFGRNNMSAENKVLTLAIAKAEREALLIDGVTGLANKEKFTLRLANSIKHERRDFVCAVAWYDVSNFGDVNDNLSHHAGDIVRDCAVDSLKSTFRTKSRHQVRIDYPDLIARLGGDEFGSAVYLEELLAQEAHEAALLRGVERCCASFDQELTRRLSPEWVAALKGEKSAQVAAMKIPTLNPGVVVVHGGTQPRVRHSAWAAAEQILNWADELMYQSKQYERDYGTRRIFYAVVEFRNRKAVKVREGYFEEGKAA